MQSNAERALVHTGTLAAPVVERHEADTPDQLCAGACANARMACAAPAPPRVPPAAAATMQRRAAASCCDGIVRAAGFNATAGTAATAATTATAAATTAITE